MDSVFICPTCQRLAILWADLDNTVCGHCAVHGPGEVKASTDAGE